MIEILPQLLVNALIAGSIYALASAGLSLTYGLLRILNFAHGHIMMVGVYFFYFLSDERKLSLIAATPLTILFSAVFAALTLWIFILPFSRYSVMLTLVSTMALGTILESAISMIFGVNVKALSVGSNIQSIEIRGVYITPIQITIIVSALLLVGFVAFIIHSTSIGRRIRAVSEDPYSAASVGVSQRAVTYGVYIVSVILTTYAGIMVGCETNMQPTMGNVYTIKAFAAMILGGLGNIWGTIAGSYILGLVENLSIGLDFGGYSIPAGYKDAFAFSIILVMLLVKPEGIFSRQRRRA